jgi:dienelactone hydrolase
MKLKFYPVFFAVLFLIAAPKTFSQTIGNNILTERPNTPINEMINGYIEVLPLDYNSNLGRKFPLIIFLEGQAQFGDGSANELKELYGVNEGTVMLPDLVKNGQFTNTYSDEFVVIIPQVRAQVQNGRPDALKMASPEEVNDIISYALQNYRVDVTRIYLMGLSIGGGSAWNYAGYSFAYSSRVAAIVPFAGASNLWDDHSRVSNIAAGQLPVWTFVVSGDHPYDTLAQRYIDSLNTHSGYTAERLITSYSTGSHVTSWENPLQNNTGNSTYPNLYEWLLTKSRGSLTQPVFATVNAGTDQNLPLSNGSMILTTDSITFNGATITLNGSASPAPGRTITNHKWVKVNGQGGDIVDPNSYTTTVEHLKPGFYTFQLRVTDDQGLISVDIMNVTVTAPPENKYVKVEAENFSALNPGANWYDKPVLYKSFIDQGAAYGLGSFDAGMWAEFSPVLPAAGTYALYYRVRSLYGNSVPIDIIVDGTTTYSRTFNNITWNSSSVNLHLSSNPVIRFVFNSSALSTQMEFDYMELVLVTADAPLPIKFVYFNAGCQSSAVNLQWRTSQEQNVQRYSVQRSVDGLKWEDIGTVPALGQGTQDRSYVFTDKLPASWNSFYRIVEYDLSGKQTLSGIVKSNCSSKEEVNLYPNPSSGNSSLHISLVSSANVTVQVLDSKGALMQQKQIQLPSGISTVPLDMNNYAKGVYTLKINYGSKMEVIKMIKK